MGIDHSQLQFYSIGIMLEILLMMVQSTGKLTDAYYAFDLAVESIDVINNVKMFKGNTM